MASIDEAEVALASVLRAQWGVCQARGLATIPVSPAFLRLGPF